MRQQNSANPRRCTIGTIDHSKPPTTSDIQRQIIRDNVQVWEQQKPIFLQRRRLEARTTSDLLFSSTAPKGTIILPDPRKQFTCFSIPSDSASFIVHRTTRKNPTIHRPVWTIPREILVTFFATITRDTRFVSSLVVPRKVTFVVVRTWKNRFV